MPDYSNGEWYANYIKPLVRKGILRLNNKSAEDTVTRDLFASVLFKNFDMEFPREYTKVFTDLDSNEAIYDIYMTAYSSGALSGIIQGDEFGAGTEVSRIEALQAIYNCLDVEDVPDVDELPYNDIGGITPEQKTVLAYFYENQYIAASESFRPQDGITIAELAVVLGNLTGIDLGAFKQPTSRITMRYFITPMGLFAYYIDNEMTGYEIKRPRSYYYEDIPGMSVMSSRRLGSFEPEEGKYDWSLIDMALQKYGGVGMQVALRITCATFLYHCAQWVWTRATYGMWGSSWYLYGMTRYSLKSWTIFKSVRREIQRTSRYRLH